MIGFLERITVIGIMGKYVERNRYKILFFFLFLFLLLAIIILPIKESLTPQINTMEGTLYGGNANIETVHTNLAFWGANMSDVDTVYIDGEKNEQCQIVSTSNNKIVIDVPQEVYRNKENFAIQVSKKIGGVWEFKGREFEVSIAECEVEAPILTESHPDSIELGKEWKKIILTAENLTEDSKLYLNGIETNAWFDYENGKIGIHVGPDMYQDRKMIDFKLGIDLNGQTQRLWSNPIEIPVTQTDYKQYAHSYDFAAHSQLIMHAAGEWNNYTYSNCLEAFQYNYERGCRTFEIDLIETSDGVIVGRHDWTTVMYDKSLVSEDTLLIEETHRNNLPKTYEELMYMYTDRTPLTWEDILQYLSMDEDLYIVTDTKDYTDEAIEKLFNKMITIAREEKKESVLNRVVVQVYSQAMYRKVMSIYPFPSVIYTLYQSPDSNEEVLEFIDHSNVRMITLPKNTMRDDDAFFQELLNRGCYIYVHTLNDIPMAAEYYDRGVTGIYTDIIRPENGASIQEEIDKINASTETGSETTVPSEAEIQAVEEELQFNKEYLLNYLKEINNENYLVLMSVQDEATAMVDDEIAAALSALGVCDDYRDAFRLGYVGILSNGEAVYEEISDEVIEYTYISDTNVFELKSAGHEAAEVASIRVDGSEKITSYKRGLHIVVFNKEKGIVEDYIVFDLCAGLGHSSS